MKRTVSILAGLLLSALGASAQQVYDLMEIRMDSIVVKERRPVRPEEEATVGTRVTRIPRIAMEVNQTKSLSELLSNNTNVYIKSLGQGALATSSFRGTASSHTKVNWNGITINPSMSSSFDFSQVPVFFADDVVLYHGGAHLKNGTGGLGGSINLVNTPGWNDPTRMKIFTEIGANETYTAAASVRFVQPKSLFQTRVYYQQSENDFQYLNKVLKLEPFKERRKEARYQQTGVMQEAYFRTGDHSQVSTNLWFQAGQRRLPQPIIVNVTEHEKQKDYGLKYYLGYDYEKGKNAFSAKAAYLLSILDYNKWFDNDYFQAQGSFNRMQSVQLKTDYTRLVSEKFQAGVALMYNHDFVHASNYQGKTTGRDIVDLQANLLWHPLSWLTVNGQVMEEFNDSDAATTFAAGFTSSIVPGLFTAKGSVSYNYKFPSLNDLYWSPGGNPDLLPEKGMSYDFTLNFTPKIAEPLYLKVTATYYLMNVDNWIMWLPTMNWYWQPRNVQNVLSHGLEVLTEWNLVLDRFRARLGINYSYSPSINRERNFEEDDTYRKQLPYIPLHKANANLHVEYRNFFLNYVLFYTGRRYTTQDESYSTNAYTVHDAEIGYNWKLGARYKLTPKISVQNLFDEYYESTQYYPMPLRYISGSLTLTF